MYTLKFLRVSVFLITALVVASTSSAQQDEPYRATRTEYGHPDIQGVWVTEFLTMVERPPGVDTLVVPPAQAAAIATAMQNQSPEVIDPQTSWDGVDALARVQGEFRTSIIVHPENGLLPYSDKGLAVATWALMRDVQLFDNPEQRPLAERCMESLGYAPIRTVPVFLPRKIIQTRDQIVIYAEDQVGLRTIYLDRERNQNAPRSIEGYSTGHWEGDTLVVETSHFRGEDPARFGIGRPILIGPDSYVHERFTRVSATELLYQFTVEDTELYTQPWRGEFSFALSHQPVYEYACHEGNYSMPAILRGGRAEMARKELAELN